MSKLASNANWERLLAHAATLQTRIPGAVLVGETAAALHARHRFSFDHDHVVRELSKGYGSAMAALESVAGWRTRRRVAGKMILGVIDGIPAGLRNLRRSAPLETMELRLGSGRRIRLPTVPEMLRIKAFLCVERNATRDYLDVAALSQHLGLKKSVTALEPMDTLYKEFVGESGSLLATVVVTLATPEPNDLDDVDLSQYKGIVAPWNSWRAVEEQCRRLSAALLQSPGPG